MDSRIAHKCKEPGGSALVLVVVLVSLLAVVGMMFFMTARVNNMGVSAVSENKELGFAIETVIARISEQLVADVPGSNTVAGYAEYYDYPGPDDPWLASLEPYKDDANNYCWRRISDIYNRLDANNLQAIIIPDYQKPSDVGDSNGTVGYPSDADGDGVADSRWIEVNDITSNKGRPVYAAIRIVDNGGMINVNTARQFDPNSNVEKEINGSRQTQINLFALAQRGTSNTIGQLDNMRKGGETWDLDRYIDNVVWRIERPAGLWTPFDISDELKLRNRYILNYNLITSRIEELWENVYDVGPRTPIPTSIYPFSRWPNCTILGTVEPNVYDYRHISTTYNFDRFINPSGKKMVNVNKVDEPNYLVNVNQAILESGIDNATAAQIAVNLKDYIDSDSDVISFAPDVNSPTYYGFESPCIYISELAHRFYQPDLNDPTVYMSYAVELYKPYSGDKDPNNGWQLVIDGSTTIAINNWSGNEQFYVILKQDSNAPLEVDLGTTKQNEPFAFTANTEISLQRPVHSGGYVTVDSMQVPDINDDSGWLVVPDPNGAPHSIQRDITQHKCIRRLWDSDAKLPTLGGINDYIDIDPNSQAIQAHPADSNFTNVGEIGMLFRKSAYSQGPYPIEPNDTEATARLNLADPCYHNLFQYLTVFDPNSDRIDNDGDGFIDAFDINTPEYKVAGRININTAPWYVIAQLPWVSEQLAQAIVAFRDKLDLSPTGPKYDGPIDLSRPFGFASIGGINLVNESSGIDPNYSIQKYALDTGNLEDYPDLSYDDIENDFEERDIIFSRISNLVTVRSDVFTAYILVRLGTDGPQKRVIAILDRSGATIGNDRVKVVALHLVPDPR